MASEIEITKASELASLNDHVADRICRIGDAIVRVSAKAIKKRWGLRHTDLRLLISLDDGESLPVREISRRIHVDLAWVSRSIKVLEKDGLLKKGSDKRDSRLTLVSLTSKGKNLLDNVRPYTLYSEKLFLNGVDGKVLKLLLDKVENNLTELEDAQDSANDD